MGTQLKISELINDIRRGQMILPEFQRGYVWSPTKVREYLSSLYKGYPTGNFLIWKTPNPGRVRGATPDSDTGSFQLILDGQQRLTSIYALVTGEPPPFYEGEALYFNIFFNVLTEEFSYFKPTVMKGKPEWLPVTKFLQQGLGKYLKAGGPITSEQRDYLFEFYDQIQDLDAITAYTYYLDVFNEHDMDDVVKIFNLVNSQGTPLSKSDLALSHICSLWPEARQTMRTTQKEFAAEGFKFGLDFFIRCTSSVATKSGLYEPLYKVRIEEIKAAWGRTKQALAYLLNVLRFDALIDSSDSFTSPTVLVPLTVYLANGTGKFVDSREKQKFLHWMYAALMWGRYSGSAETKLAQDLVALKTDDPTAKLRDNILADRGRIQVEARDLVSTGIRSSFATMCYVVARSAGAVDWFNGLPLYSKLIGKSHALQYHHIFPQRLLYKKAGYESTSRPDVLRVNEIANIAFLTQEANLKVSDAAPATYLPEVLATYPNALTAQSVPTKPALWHLDQYEQFLGERRESLASAINRFMETLLIEPGTTRFTISDYIAAGESETLEFKSSMRWDIKLEQANKALEKVIAKTLAAFMNSNGGTLIIGVSDDGKALGLELDFRTLGQRKDRDGWEQALRNTLNTYLSKELAALIEVSFAEHEAKSIAVVHADSARKPVYLMDGQTTEFYVRSGNTTQQLDVRQSNEYIKQHFAVTS